MNPFPVSEECVPCLSRPTVLFPQVVQLLLLEDSLTRRTVESAVRGKRLLILVPNEPRLSAESVAFEPGELACLAQVTSAQFRGDGRTSVLLRGLARVRCDRLTDVPSRSVETIPQARIAVVPDRYPQQPSIDRAQRRAELLQSFHELFPRETLRETLGPLLEEELSLGGLCDLLAHSLHLSLADGLEILRELNVDARTDLVLMKLRQRLREALVGGSDFPPWFSDN